MRAHSPRLAKLLLHACLLAVCILTAACGRQDGRGPASAASGAGFVSVSHSDKAPTSLPRELRRMAFTYRGFVGALATVGDPLPPQYATNDGSRPDPSQADLEGEPIIYTPYPLSDITTVAGKELNPVTTVLVDGGKRGGDARIASGLIDFRPGQRSLVLMRPAPFKGAGGALEVQESLPLDSAGRVFCAEDRWLVSDVASGPFTSGALPITATGDPAHDGGTVAGRWVPLTALLTAAGLPLP